MEDAIVKLIDAAASVLCLGGIAGIVCFAIWFLRKKCGLF